MHLARKLAARVKRRMPRFVELQELEADAYLGLAEAARTFDPSRCTAFGAFATSRINGAILDGLRQRHQVRRNRPPPAVISLSTLVDRGDGIRVPLAETLLADDPPVGQRLELLDEAQKVLASLTPAQRQQFTDVHLHGVLQKQIAQNEGVSQAAISHRMKRIRRRIAACGSFRKIPQN